MTRPPCESHYELNSSGIPEAHKLVDERQHGGTGDESGRDDEIVVADFDAPRAADSIHEATFRTSS
jgi:hypothetical protein